MELKEVGKTKIIRPDPNLQPVKVEVIMCIKSPRGMMQLFKSSHIVRQCQAIKAFMEEHNDEA